MTKKRIHKIYGIALGAMLIVAGICLIAACVGIYLSGDKPFSPASVAVAFSGIAIPVYLCLALIVGGFILDGFFAEKANRLPPEKQYGVILSRLHEKLDTDRCDPQLQAQIIRQQKNRRLHKCIGAVLLLAGSVVFLCYGLNGANFDQQDITGSMVKAMHLFIPCLAVPFLYAVFSAYYQRRSIQKEIALVKEAIAAAPAEKKAAVQPKDRSKLFLGLRLAVLGLAVAVMLYGFFSGGTNDVLTKAINICTECVGLG